MLSLSLSNISNSSRKKITQSNQAAASFDGTNDFIDASLLGPNIDKTSGSISHWVKITASANNAMIVPAGATIFGRWKACKVKEGS